MKIYECGICGNTYDEEKSGKPFAELDDGWQCPVCGAPRQTFSCPDDADSLPAPPVSAGGASLVYECGVCGNTYNEEKSGKAFGALDSGWQCSVCGAPKSAFSCPDDAADPTVEDEVRAGATLIYQCSVCGHLYDESKCDTPFVRLDPNWCCPVCGAPKFAFHTAEDRRDTVESSVSLAEGATPLAYPEDFARAADDTEHQMSLIHHMAVTGESLTEPMCTRLPVTSWDSILLLGAQLAPFPLEENAAVDTKTVIGKNAAQPMEISMPIFISHMSFGALSREVKIALAMGAQAAGTAMCSGEGGILPDEFEAAGKYIFEYVPNQYSVTDENLKKVDAIEIKIGQGTKPGMGGHLPGSKVTEEIAEVRGKPVGQDIISPSRIPGVNSKEDLKKLVADLRTRSGGRPVGVKIAAGHIEKDMAVAAYAQPDFVTIDGRGGATGASPKYLKDAASVPTIFALYRARKYLDENKLDMQLVVTGGLRTSSDFIKALAMGADAVAVASAALMAAACQQYRVCHTGKCPTGVMTQDPTLRKNLKTEAAARRVANFLTATHRELETFCRIAGHERIADFSTEDLCTVDSEISGHTNIPHA